MTDMSPDWEEWRGWSDETGPDQGNFLYIGVLPQSYISKIFQWIVVPLFPWPGPIRAHLGPITNPDIQNTNPDIQNINTDIQNTSPDIQNTSPDVQNTSPDIQNTSPDIQNGSLHIKTHINVRKSLISCICI